METKKIGKYAGECPGCNLVLMEDETSCARCGATFNPATLRPWIWDRQANNTCDCDADCICTCGHKK